MTNIGTNVHRVRGVRVGKINNIGGSFTRVIGMTDDDGANIEVTLFASNSDDLLIKASTINAPTEKEVVI